MQFLLIGGLGDSEESLRPWINPILGPPEYYTYVPVNVTGMSGFQHRVETLRTTVLRARDPVCIIGQSAGALAALIVASQCPEKIKGVIAVSPAMPRGISPLSFSLMTIMWKYYHHMYMSHLIQVTEKDYTRLALNGVSKPEILLAKRQNISGREAYELASGNLQPMLGQITTPVVLVYGTKDHWVNPKAQQKLYGCLGARKTVLEVRGAGHLPAHHKTRGAEVVKETSLSLTRLILSP